jgi:hypothetical protein
MKKGKVIAWDIALLVGIVLFLSTRNLGTYNLIIGLAAVNVLGYCVKYHIDYFKTTGKIY